MSNGGKWVRKWYVSYCSWGALLSIGNSYFLTASPSFYLNHVQQEGLEIAILQREQGLDFPSLVSSRRLTYINGLIDPAPSQSFPPHNPNVTNFNLGSLQDLENVIISYAEQNQGSVHAFKIVLLMDGLDFLLATQPSITSLTLSRTIMTLRQHVHNTIVTASADYPLLHNSSPAATPLEREHRAFVASMAHQSRVVAQLRSLGTGAAKDISGVLRISTGGGYDDVEEQEAGFEEGEWLYQVKGDGSVRVWERGE